MLCPHNVWLWTYGWMWRPQQFKNGEIDSMLIRNQFVWLCFLSVRRGVIPLSALLLAISPKLGKGNVIFCFTGSRENYFRMIGRQKIILSFRVDKSPPPPKIKIFMIEVKKRALFGLPIQNDCNKSQHKLRMKATLSLYSVIQRCQVHWIFVFYWF